MDRTAQATAAVEGDYALLADGTTIQIRPTTPADLDAVRAMHEAMSPDNIYLRFFCVSRLAAEQEAQRVCREPGPDHFALLALLDGEVIGCASIEPTRTPGVGEIALAVADHMHGCGTGTLLLEYLISAARSRGVHTFTASILVENAQMLKVFADAKLHATRRSAEGVMELSFDVPSEDSDPAWQPYLEAMASRESHADVESLRHLLDPASVAVIGASRRPGSVGRAVLHNIITGGYTGRVYPVNPHARHIEGVRCVPSVDQLPEPVDLAVVAVPPAAIAGVAEECGRHGVRALVVITAGLDDGQGADLLAACRRHGMRLSGPDCFGVAVPGIGLDATFAASHPLPGPAGLVMQSGGLGVALAGQLSRIGVGISSFVSVGSKYDVSGNDMLAWWAQDRVTRLAVLYLESFGNPRKFVAAARRVGQRMPVLAVPADQPGTGAGPDARGPDAGSDAAAITSLVSREALFAQAGIIAISDLGELLDAAAQLATQPVPAGPRVVIVSNVAGAGALAASACAEAGLVVHRVTGGTRRRLRSVVPPGGTVTGPVYTTTTISEAGYRRCLELAAADEGADAVIALAVATGATGNLGRAVREAEIGLPLAAVMLDQPEGVRLLPRQPGGPGTAVPAYAYPESAARALGHAAAYGAWRAGPQGRIPQFAGLDPERARGLAQDFLRRAPAGGWLAPAQAADLLRCYGIPLRPLIADRTRMVVSVADDPVFGPLVALGAAGPGSAAAGPGSAATGAGASQAARLAPLTDTDADDLIRAVPAAPLLFGREGSPAERIAGLRDVVLRLSHLADDLTEIAELHLDVAADRAGRVVAADARVRMAPGQLADPFLRKLR
ncbi:MAG TPA: GNAT family N-acetyltransferase [Streptosporangiaceae bacterium]|nr:GNAT family N-acetyltransferase [Streptosporangiaceae bacterium]